MTEYIVSVLPYALFAAAFLFGSFVFGKYLWQKVTPTIEVRERSIYPEPTEEDYLALSYSQQQDQESSTPRCPCGELATHAAPRLVRERIDGRQQVFASAPRYRRVIPRESYLWGLVDADPSTIKPDLCEAHAHMADSELDQFIFTEIRARQAKLNQEIASRASEFETEKLMQRIRDNLTEEQKKKVRQIEQASRRQLKAVNGGPISSDFVE